MLKPSDIELLSQLYGIHSPTGEEWELIGFVRRYVAEHVPRAKVRIDGWGNLYITKGKGPYPTLVCHLDQVQALHSDDFEVRQEEDNLMGWSNTPLTEEATEGHREGLGADDKNGIFVALRCLEECPKLKVFMAVGEEKGCIGSNRADMDFFFNSLYVLEPDCKGGAEVHTVLRGMPCASEEFEQALRLEDYGMTITEGKTSDILALTLNGIGVSCANIPAGYHNPHKDDEYTSLTELENTLRMVMKTITTLEQRFPHRYLTPTQQRILEFKGLTDNDLSEMQKAAREEMSHYKQLLNQTFDRTERNLLQQKYNAAKQLADSIKEYCKYEYALDREYISVM